jgi:WG containing repeat
MRNVIILWVGCLVFSMAVTAQELKEIDYVAPFREGLAAVKKGEQWGFINLKGEVVIDYRDDILIPSQWQMPIDSKDKANTYPFFNNGRCLIQKTKNGIDHFGYIDSQGVTVIEPTFINATYFSEGYAIVLKVSKQLLGKNELLDKDVVSYSYNEIVIDDMGKFKTYLRGPKNLLYDKEYLKSPPRIHSRFISPNLIAVKTENNTWKINIVDK